MGFFKAYDMRGTFGVDFDLDTVYKVGLALPKVVKGKRWLFNAADPVHEFPAGVGRKTQDML